MAWPTSLQVALKEWASVCRALESGRQTILLRKGGIYESAGEFEVENREFLLFPTYVHQKREMLKPAEHESLEAIPAEEPKEITISTACVVSDIIPITDRTRMDALDDEHVWAPPLIDMRFNYKPENPLYLLIVRGYRLAQPVTVDNTPAYAGCKSWVPLQEAIDTAGAAPALTDDQFAQRRSRIKQQLRL